MNKWSWELELRWEKITEIIRIYSYGNQRNYRKLKVSPEKELEQKIALFLCKGSRFIVICPLVVGVFVISPVSVESAAARKELKRAEKSWKSWKELKRALVTQLSRDHMCSCVCAMRKLPQRRPLRSIPVIAVIVRKVPWNEEKVNKHNWLM